MRSGAVTVTNQTTLLDMVTKAIREVSEAARTVEIDPETLLVEDLSLDSLDMVAVFMHLQDEYEVELNVDEATNFRRVDDLMRGLDHQLGSRSAVA